jgi:spore maturation protein CgeB
MNPDELSFGCLEALADSRLSLNVMPWFKDGAHDRIFNSMCNGAVCITDHSKYLDEILTPDENIIFYDLKQLDKLPEIFENALNDTDKLERIQKNAFNFANREHTWYARAKQLHNELLKFL